MQYIIGLFLISFSLLMAISETNFAAYKNRLNKKPIKRTIQKTTVKKKPVVQTKVSTTKSKKLVPTKKSVVTQKKPIPKTKTITAPAKTLPKKTIAQPIIVKKKPVAKTKIVPISPEKTDIQKTEIPKGAVQSSQSKSEFFIPNFPQLSLSDKNIRQKKINQEMARIPDIVKSDLIETNIDSIVSKYPNVPADLLIDFIFTKGCGFYTNQGADQFAQWLNSPYRDFIYRGDILLDIETNIFTVKGTQEVYPKKDDIFFDNDLNKIYEDEDTATVENSVKRIVNKSIAYTRYYKKNATVNPAFGEKFTIFYIYGGGYPQFYFSPEYDSVYRMLVVNGIAEIVVFNLIDLSDKPMNPSYFKSGMDNKPIPFKDIHQFDYTYEMMQLIWDDIDRSIKEYKKTHPEVKKTALMGFSFGGFNVANMATDKRYNGIVDKFMAFKGLTEWNKKSSSILANLDYAPTKNPGQRNPLLSPRDKINDLKKPILFINSPDDDRIIIESALDVWNSAHDDTKKLLFFYFDYFNSHGEFNYESAKYVFDIITSFLKNNKPSDPVVMQTRLYKALKLNTSVEGYVKTHERRSLEDLFVAKALEEYYKQKVYKYSFEIAWKIIYEPLLNDFAGINKDQAKWMLKNSLNSLKKNRLKVVGHALRQEAERQKQSFK